MKRRKVLFRYSQLRSTCPPIALQVCRSLSRLRCRQLEHVFCSRANSTPDDTSIQSPHFLTTQPASFLARLHLSPLIARTSRDLEDAVVLLLASRGNRLRLSRQIAAAAVGGSASGVGGSASGGFVENAGGVSLNAALRLVHEALMLGHGRVIVAEKDERLV